MCDYLRLYKPTVYHSVQTQKHVNRTTCLFSIRSNLPHNSSHHVSPFWVSLNPNYRTLTKNLANNNFIDVFNVLIKAETPAWLEYSPYLGDDNLWIEVLTKEHRAHNRIKSPICKCQICRVTLLKAQVEAVLGCVCCSSTQI